MIAPGQSEATPRVRADISGEKSGKRESGKAGKTLTRIAPISTNYLTVPFCRHCGVAANCLSSVAVLQRMGCSPPSKKTSLGLKAAVVGVAVEVRRRCGGGAAEVLVMGSWSNVSKLLAVARKKAQGKWKKKKVRPFYDSWRGGLPSANPDVVHAGHGALNSTGRKSMG